MTKDLILERLKLLTTQYQQTEQTFNMLKKQAVLAKEQLNAISGAKQDCEFWLQKCNEQGQAAPTCEISAVEEVPAEA